MIYLICNRCKKRRPVQKKTKLALICRLCARKNGQSNREALGHKALHGLNRRCRSRRGFTDRTTDRTPKVMPGKSKGKGKSNVANLD